MSERQEWWELPLLPRFGCDAGAVAMFDNETESAAETCEVDAAALKKSADEETGDWGPPAGEETPVQPAVR
jgi:hypothetical protein